MNCFEAQVTLRTLEGLADKKFPVRGTLRISTMIRRLSEIVKVVNERRIEIAEELADKNEEGQPVVEENRFVFSGENEREFNRRYNELMEEEVDFNLTLPEKYLGDVELSVNEIAPLVALGLIETPK